MVGGFSAGEQAFDFSVNGRSGDIPGAIGTVYSCEEENGEGKHSLLNLLQ